mmetsp:Transcript_7736/g.16766  ORF Transcript_7736/g.16766 Transcript_7736/m.16766 type:complete len:564 (+) Transcript_7736:67-1758(+)
MSPSERTKTPQPRGLPGFLRRTFRNSNDQDITLDSPSSAPGTPVLPDDPYITRSGSAVVVDNIIISGSSNEGDSVTSENDGGRSKSEGSRVGSNADSNRISKSPGSANNEKDANNRSDRSVKPANASYARGPSIGSKKHLRAVAFPPLPREQDGDDSDDSDDYSEGSENSSHKANSSAAKATQPLSNNNSSSSSNNDPPVTYPKNSEHLNTSPTTTATPTTTSSAAPPQKTYKEIQFESMLSSSSIPLRDLRKLAWNGIPPPHRPTIWKILLGYLPSTASRHKATLARRRREYKSAIKQHYDIPDDTRTNSEQETLRQVLVDVPRTMPEVPLFHNDRVRRCLSRLLYIWAMRHPASSYVQGINDLATPLIAVFLSGYFDGKDCLDGEVMGDVTDVMLEEVEADTYWCLTNLLAGIQDHYTSDQPGMQRMVMHLEELVNRIDADLASHLRHTGIEFLQFAFKWMNCLLLREFRLSCVMRLWDTYLSEGDGGFEDFHVYVCASFLVHFSSELQQMGFDELFQFMQNMPTHDWGDREIEILLSSAFVLSTLFGDSEAHLNVVRQSA